MDELCHLENFTISFEHLFNGGIRLRLHQQGQEILRVWVHVICEVIPITLRVKHLVKNKTRPENLKHAKEKHRNLKYKIHSNY